MSNQIAKKQLSKKVAEFWEAVKHVNPSNAHAVGVTGKRDIVHVSKLHYNQFFNSYSNNVLHSEHIRNNLHLSGRYFVYSKPG